MTQPPGQAIAERLRKARISHDWSQSDLAVRSGLKPSAISHFESGRRKPSAENIKRLCHAMALSADYLLATMLSDHPMYAKAKRIMQAISKMSDTDKEVITKMAEILAEKHKKPMAGYTGD